VGGCGELWKGGTKTLT